MRKSGGTAPWRANVSRGLTPEVPTAGVRFLGRAPIANAFWAYLQPRKRTYLKCEICCGVNAQDITTRACIEPRFDVHMRTHCSLHAGISINNNTRIIFLHKNFKAPSPAPKWPKTVGLFFRWNICSKR